MLQNMPMRETAGGHLAQSSRGMVTSPHELASQTGLDVLSSGGNAVEAAITIASCLCVTYPHFSGFGGDSFLLIGNAQGEVLSISGIGQAAQNCAGYSGAIPLRGPRAMLTSAATVDALGKAFDISRTQLGGRKSWEDLLKPAALLARNGFPMSASQAFWLKFRQPEMSALTGVASAFLIEGKVPEIGTVIRQPHLAATIETLAKNGPRDFYDGALAKKIAEGLREAGSPLDALDLAKTQARIEPPLSVDYRGGTLLAHQPPTQGITTLEIMGILERFDLSSIKEGSADFYHLLVEAVKQAFLDRNRYIADPDFVEVPAAHLLSNQNLNARAHRISMSRALPWPGTFQNGDTVFIAAADDRGNSVSMLSTIYFDWGSGILVGDTGLLWHNRGASFSLDPAHPNYLQPGKRPFHTLNPGMYRKGGKINLLFGTQGADGQPQTLSALLTRLIDYKMDPLTALARPRFLLGKTFSNAQDSLKLEEDIGEEVIAELAARGHQIARISAQSPLAGHAGAFVLAQNGLLSGAHDPRSDGRALGLK